MAPVFERPDKAEIEAAAEKLWSSVKDEAKKVEAKVVKGKEQPEPATSEAEVETK